jgi:endonuclease/exonuclease/phosphatase family metal-dependent hydrolase
VEGAPVASFIGGMLLFASLVGHLFQSLAELRVATSLDFATPFLTIAGIVQIILVNLFLAYIYGGKSALGGASAAVHAEPSFIIVLPTVGGAIGGIVTAAVRGRAAGRRGFGDGGVPPQLAVGRSVVAVSEYLVAWTTVAFLVALPVMAYTKVTFGDAGAHGVSLSLSDSTLVVTTFNVQQSFTYDATPPTDDSGLLNFVHVIDVLERSAAHVICLQESDPVHTNGGTHDVVTFIQAQTGYHGYFGLDGRDSSVGVAILSVEPLREAKTTILPTLALDDPECDETGACPLLNRLLVEGRVTAPQIGVDDLLILCTHVSAFSEVTKELQAAALANRSLAADAIEGPLILAGDFNMPTEGDEVDPVLIDEIFGRAALSTALNVSALPDTSGSTQTEGAQVIDYIFYRNLSLVSSFLQDSSVAERRASDHFAITAIFDAQV